MAKVLVVDDEDEIREICKYHLGKAGYTVIEAEDGEKAIERMSEGNNSHEIDTVIIDIKMPKINGIEAISYFKKDFPTLPLIVITGIADTKLKNDLLEKGVKEFLLKPVEKEKLLKVVKKAVSEREQA